MKTITHYLILPFILLIAFRAAGQAPSISYGNGFYTLSPTIPVNIAPTNTGGVVPATVYGKVVNFVGSPSGGSGYINSTDTSAQFSTPTQMVKDSLGNLYVADGSNNAIRMVTPAGVVTTFAGSSFGLFGYADSTGTAALFYYPDGIAIDGSGNLFVSDYNNNAIRKITPARVVSTFYVSSGTFGPGGLCFDNSGNLIVTAQDASQIISINPSGVATVVAGSSPGYMNGPVSSAEFNTPTDVRVDPSGNIYVVDFENNAIRKITPAGDVSTFAGSAVSGNTPGYGDGIGTAAVFNNPGGLAIGPGGVIYVADMYNNDIRRIMPDGTVSLLAGSSYQGSGNTDGTGSAAGFNLPGYIYIDNTGMAYVAELGANRIRKLALSGYSLRGTLPSGLSIDSLKGTISGTLSGALAVKIDTVSAWNAGGYSSNSVFFHGSAPVISYDLSTDTVASGVPYSVTPSNTGGDVPATTYATVSTFAGSTSGTSGFSDAAGTSALFNSPNSGIIDVFGNTYIADANNNAIRKIDASGSVTTFAGSTSGTSGSADGNGTAALFNSPAGIAEDASGNLIVSDYGNNSIRKVAPDGAVSTFYHSTSTFGPAGLTVDGSGNIIVAAKDLNQIMSISPSAVASTVAGSTSGYTNASGAGAQFNSPTDVKIDGSGNLFVADYSNNAIREIDPSGNVTTFAGSTVSGNTGGYKDTIGLGARFNKPMGLAVAPGGVIYVADYGNNVVRRIMPDSTVSLAAGSTAHTTGNSDGIDSAASFNGPNSVYLDNSGTGYITESGGNRARKIVLTGYSLAGTLPSGLSLDASTGIISGTVSGSVTPVEFGVTAFNAAGFSVIIPLLGGATNDWLGTGIPSTDWGTVANWSAGHAPTTTETARIGTNVSYTNQPTLNATVTIGTLSFGALAPGGKPVLTINAGKTLTSSKGFTIATSTGVTINGPGELNIGATSVLSASTVSLVAASDLTITIGAINSFINNTSGGTFTLASDASGCASIAAIPATSGVNGPVTVQRYITGGSGYRGYRTLSSAVWAANVAPNHVYSINYLQNNTYITGTGGASNGFDLAGNPTIYFYREDRLICNSTFTCGNFSGVLNMNLSPNYNYSMDPEQVINPALPPFNLPVGNGFLFFFRGEKPLTSSPYVTTTVPITATTSETGTLNQGQITVHEWFTPGSANLSYLSPSPTVIGDALVGNPYPSSIDWDKFQTSSPTTGLYGSNVSAVYMALVNNTGSYGFYLKGSGMPGVGGLTNIIPSGSGFYITANAANGAFIFNESAKTSAQLPSGTGMIMSTRAPEAKNKQYIRLEFNADSVHYEDILLWFDSAAKTAFEPDRDGRYKLGYNIVSLSSLSSDGVPLGFDQQPLPGAERRVIALNVGAKHSGTYHFNLRQVVGVPEAYDVVLLDNFKKDSVDLRSKTEYEFQIDTTNSSTFGNKRFSLVIEQNPAHAYKLLDFTAYKLQTGTPQVQAEWKTKNEGNSTYFTVERSTDGGKTYAIMGSANAANQGIYSFVDKNPVTGQNLYRLRQEDMNHAISYSKVVQIVYNGKNNNQNNIVIYPNPASNNLALSILANTNNPTVYHVTFTNSVGVVVKDMTLSSNSWNGNVNGLLPGNYVVWVTDSKTQAYVGEGKFIKL